MAARFIHCADAVLVRPLGPHTWLARLPNGHELAALVPRDSAGLSHPPSIGERVELDISPADFTHARIRAMAGPAPLTSTPGPGRPNHDL